MSNNISLTLRMPHELDKELSSISTFIGITKSNLIRESIHRCLCKDYEYKDYFPETPNEYRIALNINENTYKILENYSNSKNISMNSAIIFSIATSVKYYSKLIKELH